MKRLVSSLMLLAALWVPAAAQTTQAKLVSELEKVFEPWNRSDAPGGVVGIYKDGKPLFVRGYGLANMEHNVAMRPDTVIDIGSVSKQFTTACIYLLEEDGKLSVNDDVRKHIPSVDQGLERDEFCAQRRCFRPAFQAARTQL
jgi:CubicO group peptidase (beta-lactamase class C family)